MLEYQKMASAKRMKARCCKMSDRKIQVRVKRILGQYKNGENIRDYDELTGLYNKNMFLRIVKGMLSSHEKEQFVFIRMDINQFQLLNQLYGFEEGDKLEKLEGLLE